MNMATTSTSRSRHDFNALTRAWPGNLHVFAPEITTTFQLKEALLELAIEQKLQVSTKAFSAA